MRLFLACVIFLSLLILPGCMAPVVPPPGFIFSNTQAPIDTDVNKTPVSQKSGESASYCILYLFAFGDASVHQAALNGGLNTVEHVDYKYLNVLLFYQSFTTVAYGE